MEYSVLWSCVIDCVTGVWSYEFTVKVPWHFRFRNTSKRATERIVISVVCDINGRLWRCHQLWNIYKIITAVCMPLCLKLCSTIPFNNTGTVVVSSCYGNIILMLNFFSISFGGNWCLLFPLSHQPQWVPWPCCNCCVLNKRVHVQHSFGRMMIFSKEHKLYICSLVLSKRYYMFSIK